MPAYKLTYFDIRGRGEIARLLFAAGGVEFEDNRITLEQWPELKPKMPNGQIPVLEIDGKQYSQSLAIARYLATEFKLMGSNSLEDLRIDEFVGTMQDLISAYVRCVVKNKDKDEKLFTEFRETELPRHLKVAEDFLAEKSSGYFIGNAMTLADIILFDILDAAKDFLGDTLKECPKVEENRNLVANDPKLKEYLKARK